MPQWRRATSSAVDEGAAGSATEGAVSSPVTAETAGTTTAVILQDPNNRDYAEAVWSGRVAWGADMPPADGGDGDREADDRPPRRVAEEAGHEMMPGGRNRFPPRGRAPAPPPPPKGVGKGVMVQMPRQMHPNEVHAVVMTLMQGQTIPLQYGQWVQWDVSSWVDIAHSYRYGVLFGVQVEVDYPRVGLRQRMPTVPGVNASLPLQPKQVPVETVSASRETTEEECDPGVPFEHGMIQPGPRAKQPPQQWLLRDQRQTVPKGQPPIPKMGLQAGQPPIPQMGRLAGTMQSSMAASSSMAREVLECTRTELKGKFSRADGNWRPWWLCEASTTKSADNGPSREATGDGGHLELYAQDRLERCELRAGQAGSVATSDKGLRPVLRFARPVHSTSHGGDRRRTCYGGNPR